MPNPADTQAETAFAQAEDAEDAELAELAAELAELAAEGEQVRRPPPYLARAAAAVDASRAAVLERALVERANVDRRRLAAVPLPTPEELAAWLSPEELDGIREFARLRRSV